MHADRDLDLEVAPPANAEALTQDLELDTLLGAMASDEYLLRVARTVLLAGLDDPAAIVYRQRALADCLANPDVIMDLYGLAVEAIVAERKVYHPFLRDAPDAVLSRSIEVLELFLVCLHRLRAIADEHAHAFSSDAFGRFFAMLGSELGDDYLAQVERHLEELRFPRGALISARLGRGNKGAGYVLRLPPPQRWLERLPLGKRGGCSFRIADRDESGFRSLSELRGRGINSTANALGQSADHILGFFSALRAELAFYVACMNLYDVLAGKGEPTCFPEPAAVEPPQLAAQGLYDPCLTLRVEGRVVGNDLDAQGKRLVVVTGANQGGKSTFLRSLGVLQLMAQCGMFVAAEACRFSISRGVLTHYKREEDAEMRSGKLDEELARMSEIAEQIRPGCLLLLNESFAATNEREGSEIARQVVRALIESGVRVAFVTHLYDLAHGFHGEGLEAALFLRAERREDGRRTYRLVEGEPLATSYGLDLYRRIFGGVEQPTAARGGEARG